MYKDCVIGVIVPAYNEEVLIQETLAGVPKWVDKIIVINDCSKDNTLTLLKESQLQDERIQIIDHEVNKGLGQSLIDGYLASCEMDVDITAVMAGDNQMHPDDLPCLLDKIIENDFDYVKGNRLLHSSIDSMPTYRFIGNSILTILTKFATGYYFSMDPQCGYTAIKNTVLRKIPIAGMTTGYGYNADILCMLNIQRFKVADVEVRPVYDREKSKIRLWKYIPKTSWILTKLFFRRMWQRYIVLDFHPLVLFYLTALFTTTCILIPGSIRFIYFYISYDQFPATTFNILTTTFLLTVQLILFGIWMDMDYNKIPKE